MKKLLLCIIMSIFLMGCSKENSNNLNKKLYVIDYNDDTIPGSTYHYEINGKSNEIKMQIKHFSSTADAKTNKIDKTITIDNQEVFQTIIEACEKNVEETDWIYVFCSDLEDMEDILKDDVVSTSNDDLWETAYKECDLDNNGEVTSLEEFKYTWNLMLSELD